MAYQTIKQMSDMQTRQIDQELKKRLAVLGIYANYPDYVFVNSTKGFGFHSQTLDLNQLAAYYEQLEDPVLLETLSNSLWILEICKIAIGGTHRGFLLDYHEDSELLEIEHSAENTKNLIDDEQWNRLKEALSTRGYAGQLKEAALKKMFDPENASQVVFQLIGKIENQLKPGIEELKEDLIQRLYEIKEEVVLEHNQS